MKRTRGFLRSARSSIERKVHLAGVAQDGDSCAGDFAPVAIHGEGGFDDDDIRAGVDEGVKEEAQGVVAAVGEEELVGLYFEVAG